MPQLCRTQIALLLALLLLVLVLLPGGEAKSVQAQGGDAPCSLRTEAAVAPERVLLGEAVTVTLTVAAPCPELVAPQEIVLLLDASDSMWGWRSERMKEGAKQAVRALLPPGLTTGPATVGVVRMNSAGRIVCGLLASQSLVLACIDRVGALGGEHLQIGLGLASTALARGRTGRVSKAVLLVGGMDIDTNGCSALQSQALPVTSGQRARFAAVCMAPDCDRACLHESVSAPELYARADQRDEVGPAISGIVARLRELAGDGRAAELAIRAFERPESPYVAGSAVPPSVSAAGGLTWRFGRPRVPGAAPAGPVTVTFQVRPSEAGEQPVLAGALAAVLDHNDGNADAPIPVPRVVVLSPATVPPPEPSATATGEVAPTPAPYRSRLYVPRVVNP